MDLPGPTRAERVTEIVLTALFIAIPILAPIARAIQLRSLTSIRLAVSVVVVETALIVAIVLLRRKHRFTEEETIRRIDRAMGKPPDDPRNMANFIP